MPIENMEISRQWKSPEEDEIVGRGFDGKRGVFTDVYQTGVIVRKYADGSFDRMEISKNFNPADFSGELSDKPASPNASSQ